MVPERAQPQRLASHRGPASHRAAVGALDGRRGAAAGSAACAPVRHGPVRVRDPPAPWQRGEELRWGPCLPPSPVPADVGIVLGMVFLVHRLAAFFPALAITLRSPTCRRHPDRLL